MVGDSSTIQHHNFLKSFFEYISDNGEVRSAQSYINVNVTKNSDDATKELLVGFESLKGKNCRLKGMVCSNDSSLQDLQDAVRSSNLWPSKGTQSSKHSSTSRDCSVDNTSPDKQDPTISRECDVVDDNSKLERENVDRNVKANKAFEYTEETIEKMVVDFVNAETETILIFDSSLVNRERFWVHRLAEKYGLAHWSGGEGKDRCITIKKRTRKRSSTHGSNMYFVAKYILYYTNQSSKNYTFNPTDVLLLNTRAKLSDQNNKSMLGLHMRQILIF